MSATALKSSPSVISALSEIVGTRYVLTDVQDIQPYIIEQRDLWHGKALCVVRPASTQDHIGIADAVAARNAERAALLTRNHIARSRKSIADIINARSAREPAP